jgi:hypothetical protein
MRLSQEAHGNEQPVAGAGHHNMVFETVVLTEIGHAGCPDCTMIFYTGIGPL